MSITIIGATEPDVIPAVPERVCDKWGAYNVSVGGAGFPVLNMSIEARKFASDQHGVQWSHEQPTVINIPNMFAESDDPLVLGVISAVNSLMESRLSALGVL